MVACEQSSEMKSTMKMVNTALLVCGKGGKLFRQTHIAV